MQKARKRGIGGLLVRGGSNRRAQYFIFARSLPRLAVSATTVARCSNHRAFSDSIALGPASQSEKRFELKRRGS